MPEKSGKIQTVRAALECLKTYLMKDSGQGLEDQNADRKDASKDQV